MCNHGFGTSHASPPSTQPKRCAASRASLISWHAMHLLQTLFANFQFFLLTFFRFQRLFLLPRYRLFFSFSTKEIYSTRRHTVFNIFNQPGMKQRMRGSWNILRKDRIRVNCMFGEKGFLLRRSFMNFEDDSFKTYTLFMQITVKWPGIFMGDRWKVELGGWCWQYSQ